METKVSDNSARVVILAFLLFLSAFAIAFFDSLRMVFDRWSGTYVGEDDYSFGFLVLLSVIYLLFLKRDCFRQTAIQPYPWALLSTLMLSIGWFAAALTGLTTVQMALLPLLILSATTAFLGLGYLKLAALPVLILFFSLPLLWPLVPYLKDATTAATELFLRTIERPVFVEGYFLHLPGGSFLVDDSCAGLRFLIVTMTLTCISIDLFALKLRQGLLLLVIGILLALVANWVRVIIVVMVGDATQMQSSLVEDHYTLGWVVYCVLVLVPFYLLLRKIQLSGADIQTAGTTVKTDWMDSRVSLRNVYVSLMLACALIFVGPALAHVVDSRNYLPRDISLPPSTLGESIDRTGSDRGIWRPAYHNETSYWRREYPVGNDIVELHVVNYANQRAGAELISNDNSLADNELWSLAPGSEGKAFVTDKNSGAVTLNSVELRSTVRGSKLVWYWYEVGPYQAHNQYQAKLYQLLSLLGNRNDANLLVAASRCESQCEGAEARLRDFIEANLASIRAGL